MPDVRDLFTPLDELMATEPSYFASGPSVSPNVSGAFSQKTPVMALDEGSRRVYGVAPEYQLISEVPYFKISCQLAGTSVVGTAKTKKVAKHSAALAMLHEIIAKGRYSEFGIPGLTMEEAKQAVCQRKGFELPQYSFAEEGPPNDRIYTTTCKAGF
ncbi:hypothetical protein OESDEN_10963 [Oesophagostomum dentatum]|uniref:DRBM domain-containing protein n=1 Tax=Oesophagostomum dentatum TaxID=61180 RepID=A0A0B1SW84_OESDE|nr:hypothetical protein OESDEN_10963 [Oesophagostomum dentatum]